MAHVRPAMLAGSWYPGQPSALATAVRQYLAGDEGDAAPRPAGRPILALAPHAGYTYSGPTAGRVYAALRGWEYDRVFILAPNHRVRLPFVSVAPFDAYATPLGEVAIDTEVARRLALTPGFTSVEAAHAAEHAEEIQLPFLQTIFGERLRIVPLLVPPLAPEVRDAAATALAPWCDGRSLFLVSSDLTHYGVNYGYVPFSERIPEQLEALDCGALEQICARDPQGLAAYGRRTGITMCGLEAAALALSAPLPAGEGAVIAYARSGDRDGDYTLSVSYAGLLLTMLVDSKAHDAEASAAAPLTAVERGYLLALARRVVAAVAAGHRPSDPQALANELGVTFTPALQQPRGAFVTLTRAGALRGCIGYIEGIEPLAAAVAHNAASAALRDPRFAPIAPDEVAALHIEVSALTPLREVSGPDEIAVGRHGVVLRKGNSQAVFLPQVATEQGWDLATTLSHLAIKAGLAPDGWRRGARFQVFEAEVLGEELPNEP